MKLAYAIISVFAGALAGAAIHARPIDGDYDWQRWLGALILRTGRIPAALHNETFSAAGAAWTPHEWAFSILAAIAGTGAGFSLIALGSGLCVIATLVLVAKRAHRRHASPVATAAVTAMCGIALLESFGVRAQVIGWPLLALVLLLLDTDDGRAWYAVPVVALWSNVHASALLAPAFAGLTAVGAILDGDRYTARSRIALTFALLAATCINPFGWNLATYALNVMHNPMRAAIIEWQPTSFIDPSFSFGALPLAVACAFAGRRFARHTSDGLTLLASLWLMLSAGRNIGPFAIVAAPLAAPILDRFLERFRTENDQVLDEPRRYRVLVTACVAIGVALVPALLFLPSRASAYFAPRGALAALDRTPGSHQLFCENFAWCSVALGSQRTRVFLDGRADPYPAHVWSDYLTIVNRKPGWRVVLVRDRINAIMARRNRPLATALSSDRAWRPLYRDVRYVVFVRTR